MEIDKKKLVSEIPFMSLNQLSEIIKTQQVSCSEILEIFLNRVKKYNPIINAVIVLNEENARRRAKEADKALLAGEIWGDLHGVPFTIKDAYEVKDMSMRSGSKQYEGYISDKSSDVAQKLLDAGAIIFGKTNLPYLAADWQTYNKIYGTTNNPWDINRSPGGSSGGSAAAVSSGFTPFEIGSDLNGSVRIPAHYCGVYGHRTTHGIVSFRGHVPGEPGDLSVPDLSVVGILGRSPKDLSMILDNIVGPVEENRKGWTVTLPEPKEDKKYKVLAWLDDEFCPIDLEMKKVYMDLVEKLKQTNISVDIAKPQNYDLEEFSRLQITISGCVVCSSLTWFQSILTRIIIFALSFNRSNKVTRSKLYFLKGMLFSHRKWEVTNEKKLQLQKKCRNIFNEYDIILAPVAPWTAFPHQQTSWEKIKIVTDNVKRDYTEHVPWTSIATVLDLPATSAPVALSETGLPINIQVIGNKYMDKYTIDFCNKINKIVNNAFIPDLDKYV